MFFLWPNLGQICGQIFVFFLMFFGPNFGPNFGRLVSCESCECSLNGAAVGKDSHVKFTRSYDNRMLVGGTLLKPEMTNKNENKYFLARHVFVNKGVYQPEGCRTSHARGNGGGLEP